VRREGEGEGVAGCFRSRRPGRRPPPPSALALTDPPPPTSGRPLPSLLAAAGKLAARTALAARGTVVGAVPSPTAGAPPLTAVRLDLFLPDADWGAGGGERAAWPPSRDAALVFSWLRPPAEAAGEPFAPDGWPPSTPFCLAAAFDGLPPRSGAPPPRRAGPPPPRASLLGLPPELLRMVTPRLDPRSLAVAACACGALRDAARGAVPGLKLTLFPHQRTALTWMAARERDGEAGWEGESGAPGWAPLAGPAGTRPLHACAADGALSPAPPAAARGCRGGLLCDEPGLGKTITVLSLVLQARGAAPAPPAGSRVVHTPAGTLYHEPPDEGGGAPCGDPGRAGARRAGGPPRRAAAAAAVAGRRASAEDAALVRARAAVAAAAASAEGVRQGRAAVRRLVPAAADAPETGSGDNDDDDDDDDATPTTTTWAACDACGAWRRLPARVPAPDAGSPWTCAMQPDAEDAALGCSAPADAAAFDDATTARAGWATPGAAPDAANADFWASALAAEPRLQDWPSAAWWLATAPAAALSSVAGARVPREHRRPAAWAAFLEAAGLEPTPGDGGASWRVPAAAAGLVPDAGALRAALARAPAASASAAAADPFYVSPATLLIVPPSIEAHWAEQVALHVAAGALRVAVLSDVKTAAGAPPPSSRRRLTAADLAWNHDLVITTFPRLSAEWGRRRDPRAAPLLRVHWHRVVVDEGHLLSIAGAGLTAKMQMACALRAGRRWVVTGTPAPGAVAAAGAASAGSRSSPPGGAASRLHPLLAFLGHDPLSAKPAFDAALGRPLDAGARAAGATLASLLDALAIRASKADLASIPALVRVTTRVSFRRAHAVSYNALVESVHRSLLLADWGDPDHKESLLHPKNARWAREVVANLRAACCVAGATALAPKEEDVRETLELLADRHGHPQPAAPGAGPPWLPADHPLARVEAGLRAGAACGACGARCALPLAEPCACLVCVECAAGSREKCAACGAPHRMHGVAHPERAATNARPKWAVPFEAIEWQPAAAQAGAAGASGGHWAPTWATTRSSKVARLLASLAEAGAAPPADRPGGPPGPPPPGWTPTCKAIVFTAFWPHTLLVGRALDRARVGCVVLQGRMGPGPRAAAVDEFRHDDMAAVLIMDASGAVGLDLSFASRVYLMEPVPDPALEAQVVARAHRMGARRRVVVEALVMAGTAEEALLAARGAGGAGEGGPADDDASSSAGTLRRRVLSTLRPVPVPSPAGSDADDDDAAWGRDPFSPAATEAARPLASGGPDGGWAAGAGWGDGGGEGAGLDLGATWPSSSSPPPDRAPTAGSAAPEPTRERGGGVGGERPAKARRVVRFA